MLKKFFSVFLILCFLAPAAAAGEARTAFRFPLFSAPGSCTIEAILEDEMFSQDAFVYQHSLCQASMSLAQAAFGDSGEWKSPIVSVLTDLGFATPETRQYDVAGEDTIGTAMAWRTVVCGDSSFPLVAVAIRGGYYGDEWASNFTIGTSDIHAGFLASAQEVMGRVRAYLTANGLAGQDVRFWVTGFSRGAAVANLTAAFLAEEGIADDARIYAYTFATPRVVRGEWKGRHLNIFNIVNPNDPIPMIPPASWDYGWCGRTLYLPSMRDQDPGRAPLLDAYAQAFRELTGRQDEDAGELAGIIIPSVEAMISSPDQYVDAYQSLLSKLSVGKPLDVAEILAAVRLGTRVLSSVSQFKSLEPNLFLLLSTGQLSGLIAEVGMGILQQHCPERYAAWLTALPDGKALQESSPALTAAPSI